MKALNQPHPKESYQHIIKQWRYTGQQFRLCPIEWCYGKVDGSRKHTDDRSHKIILDGTLKRFKIIDTYGQPHTNNRSHEWRYEHGTDNNCRGMEVQP